MTWIFTLLVLWNKIIQTHKHFLRILNHENLQKWITGKCTAAGWTWLTSNPGVSPGVQSDNLIKKKQKKFEKIYSNLQTVRKALEKFNWLKS